MRKRLIFLLSVAVLVLALLSFFVVLFLGRDDELKSIDVAAVDFEYDISVCDEYFEMLECIINNDSDVRYTRQMRIDLKNEVRQMQENWRSLSSEELFNMCSNELAKFDNEIMAEKLKLINCSRE